MSSKKNNIVLIGFMGSGKTTFGKWISQNAGMAFCDIDEYIEMKQKKTINTIFAQDGEEYFRNLETHTVQQLCEKLLDCVISVGGGLPMRDENREYLKKLGTVVYLRASEDTLVNRLEGDTKRPLLAGIDVRSKIAKLMKVRSSVYEQVGDIVIDTDDKTFEQLYNEIENQILEINDEI